MTTYTLQDISVDRIEKCLNWLQENGAKYAEVQSSDVLLQDLGQMAASMAFVNEKMAKAKMVLNAAKLRAYEMLKAEQTITGFTLAPSLAKEYIAAKCVQEGYAFDICERCARTLVHTIDALRTVLSTLREEAKALQYQTA